MHLSAPSAALRRLFMVLLVLWPAIAFGQTVAPSITVTSPGNSRLTSDPLTLNGTDASTTYTLTVSDPAPKGSFSMIPQSTASLEASVTDNKLILTPKVRNGTSTIDTTDLIITFTPDTPPVSSPPPHTPDPRKIQVQVKEPQIAFDPIPDMQRAFRPDDLITPTKVMTLSVVAIGKYQDGTNVPANSITYSLVDTLSSIAKLAKNGKLQILGTGKVIVKATIPAFVTGNLPSDQTVSDTAIIDVVTDIIPASLSASGSLSLLVNGQNQISIAILNRQSEPLTDFNGNITVQTSDSTIATATNNPSDPTHESFLVQAHAPGTATLTFTYGTLTPVKVTINVNSAKGFEPVKVALDIMDEETASQLFGRKTSDNFYTMRVRLFNNLSHQNNTGLEGDAILAYSESVEAAIRLEKSWDPKLKSVEAKYKKPMDASAPDPHDGKWYEVGNDDLTDIYTRIDGNDDNPFPSSSSAKIRLSDFTDIAQFLRALQMPTQTDTGQASSKNSDSGAAAAAMTRSAGTSPQANILSSYLHERLSSGSKLDFSRFAANQAPPNELIDDVILDMNNILRTDNLFADETSVQKGLFSASSLKMQGAQRPEEVNRSDAITRLMSQTQRLGVTPEERLQYNRALLSLIYPDFLLPYDPLRDTRQSLPPAVYDENGQLRYMRHRLRYRPYTYQMMLNTVDARDTKTARSRIFQLVDSGAELAAFATTTKLWRGQAPSLVASITGLLIPTFERQFPSMKETERQNFLSMTMQPLEEVPFGSDVSRVLFFPKNAFHGILPGYKVRISAIDTSYFNITVAIVDKKKTTTTNAASQ